MSPTSPDFNLSQILAEAVMLANQHGCEIRVSKSGAIIVRPHGERKTSTERVRAFRAIKRGNACNTETHETHETTLSVSHETTPSPSPSSLSPTPPIPPPTPTPVQKGAHTHEEAFGLTAETETPKKKSRIKPASDEEWIKELEANPAYKGINIREQLGRLQAWCDLRRKQASRGRFLNWLNRAEKPMTAQGSARQPKYPSYDPVTATAGKTPEQINEF